MKEGPLVQMLDHQRVQQAATDEAKKLVDAAALAAKAGPSIHQSLRDWWMLQRKLRDWWMLQRKLRKQRQRPRRQLHCQLPKKHRSV